MKRVLEKLHVMNVMTRIGIVLIVFGLVVPIYGGIVYAPDKNVVEAASVDLQPAPKKHISLSPIAGAAAVAFGVVLIFMGRARKTNKDTL